MIGPGAGVPPVAVCEYVCMFSCKHDCMQPYYQSGMPQHSRLQRDTWDEGDSHDYESK